MNHIIITFTIGHKKPQLFRFVVGNALIEQLGVFEKHDNDALGASRWSAIGGNDLGRVTPGFVLAKALAKVVSETGAARPTLLSNINIDLGDLS